MATLEAGNMGLPAIERMTTAGGLVGDYANLVGCHQKDSYWFRVCHRIPVAYF
jgi:hypothetical protein